VAIRVVLLPGRGFPDDISAFEDWALALGTTGTAGFYSDTSGMRYPVLDYPPGYMYVLLVIGNIYTRLCQCTDHSLLLKVLEKLPAVLADFGVAAVCYAIGRSISSERHARIAALVLLVLPPLWLVSAYWGQVDSVAAFALLLTLWAAIRQRWILTWGLFACTILIKPQAAPLIPLLLVWEWRSTGFTAAFPAGIAAGGAIAYLSTIPFTIDHSLISGTRWLFERYINGIAKYPYNTTGGFTLFGITGNYFQSDGQTVLGVPLHTWGIALFLILLVATTVKLAATLRDAASRVQFLASAYVVLAGFFILSTRMHERYLMPALLVGAIVTCADRRYLPATIAYATTFTINCAFILSGFYGGAHHPVTLLAAHILAGVNVVTLIVLATIFFRTSAATTEPVLTRPLRATWREPMDMSEKIHAARIPGVGADPARSFCRAIRLYLK
jgi:dolichyl-phosphate-mannose-protein mannosyltransferase